MPADGRAQGGARRAVRLATVLLTVCAGAQAIAGCVLVAESRGDEPPAPVAAADYRAPERTLPLSPSAQAAQTPDELLASALQEPRIVRPEGPGLVATNSPRRRDYPGMVRPCDRARGFTVYGQKDAAGLPVKQVDAVCDVPPGVEDGRLLQPRRANAVVIGYGRCVGGFSPGCTRRLRITSEPSCERPHHLYHLLVAPGGEGARHREIRRRGVPGLSEDGGRTLVLFTKRTTITVTSDDAARTREAARTAMPAPSSYAPETSRYARLPAPSRAVASRKPQPTACAA